MGLYSVPLIMCLFLNQYYVLGFIIIIIITTVALEYNSQKSGRLIPPALFLSLQFALAIWHHFWLHINFKIIYSISMKKANGYCTKWIGTGVKSVDCLSSVTMLIILIFLSKSMRRLFHLLYYLQFSSSIL